MSKRTLPKVTVAARPGARSQPTPSAYDRWNPGLRAAADDEDGVISILDVIGSDFWGEGVTARRIAAALRAIGDKPVRVDINSPGGDYFEGLAIYNMLREHPQTVTVNVLGLAASAASIIAMAGDTVRVARAGFIMIHNTWVLAVGDRNDMREIAEWLEPFDAAAADVYAARTGIDRAEIAEMMDRETWLGGSAAVDKGFADELLPSDATRDDPAQRAAASLTLRKLDAVLARAGMARAERRRLLNELGATQDAGPTGTRDAADITAGVRDILAQLKAIA